MTSIETKLELELEKAISNLKNKQRELKKVKNKRLSDEKKKSDDEKKKMAVINAAELNILNNKLTHTETDIKTLDGELKEKSLELVNLELKVLETLVIVNEIQEKIDDQTKAVTIIKDKIYRMTTPIEPKKIAIIIYGLASNLPKIINSINVFLLKPLIQQSFEYDIFIHTYKSPSITNDTINTILKPKYNIQDQDEEISKSIDINEYYTKLGGWGATPIKTKQLILNMWLLLYSKHRIVSVFEKYKSKYDYGMVLRTDLLLLSAIDTTCLNKLTVNNNITLPFIGGQKGCVDHLCLAKPEVIIYYGKLLDQLKQYSIKKSIIAERYLLDKLKENKIGIIPLSIKYKLCSSA